MEIKQLRANVGNCGPARNAQAIKYKTAWAKGYGVAPDIGGELYHGEQIV